MKLDVEKVKSLCRKRGTSLQALLQEAGVSRNAFYTLARKKSIVPQSIVTLAEQLEVPVSSVLDKGPTPKTRLMALVYEAHRTAAQHQDADPDNIRHTLILLDEKPVERLRRALRRGRKFDLR
jgi:lambda repressor-like predicted transcriptional regulator